MFLLLGAPLTEQAHAEHCEDHACYACLVSTGSALPADTAYTPIDAGTAPAVAHLLTSSILAELNRSYDSRGPPDFS